MDHSAETAVGFVIRGCDAPELIDVTKEVLDQTTPAIHRKVALDFTFAVVLGRDDGRVDDGVPRPVHPSLRSSRPATKAASYCFYGESDLHARSKLTLRCMTCSNRTCRTCTSRLCSKGSATRHWRKSRRVSQISLRRAVAQAGSGHGNQPW